MMSNKTISSISPGDKSSSGNVKGKNNENDQTKNSVQGRVL